MSRRRRRPPEVEAALANLRREVAGNLRARGPGAGPGLGPGGGPGSGAGRPPDGPMVERMLDIATRRRRGLRGSGPGGGPFSGPGGGGERGGR